MFAPPAGRPGFLSHRHGMSRPPPSKLSTLISSVSLPTVPMGTPLYPPPSTFSMSPPGSAHSLVHSVPGAFIQPGRPMALTMSPSVGAPSLVSPMSNFSGLPSSDQSPAYLWTAALPNVGAGPPNGVGTTSSWVVNQANMTDTPLNPINPLPGFTHMSGLMNRDLSVGLAQPLSPRGGEDRRTRTLRSRPKRSATIASHFQSTGDEDSGSEASQFGPSRPGRNALGLSTSPRGAPYRHVSVHAALLPFPAPDLLNVELTTAGRKKRGTGCRPKRRRRA